MNACLTVVHMLQAKIVYIVYINFVACNHCSGHSNILYTIYLFKLQMPKLQENLHKHNKCYE